MTQVDETDAVVEHLATRPMPALADFSGMSADLVWRFIKGGRAVFTLKSKHSGKHFTYRIAKVKERPGDTALRNRDCARFFVAVLAGPDNTSDFQYIGMMWLDEYGHYESFKPGRNIVVSQSTEGIKYFLKALRAILTYRASCGVKGVEFYHEGKCGRCARPLTDPESCRTGFGPECRGKLGL